MTKWIFQCWSLIFLPTLALAATPAEEYALKLTERLTGSPLKVRDPVFRRMVKLVEKNQRLEAAKLALELKNFYQVRLRSFSSVFGHIEYSPRDTFNDLQALIIGITRDELDARLILTGDLRYQASSNLNLPPPSTANNKHYEEIENRMLELRYELVKQEPQWEGATIAAGAFTTRAWAKSHYDAGTNRRAVKHAMEAFLCSPIEQWKTPALPDYFVRRDVDRAPGGNPSTFQNHCRTCHGPMDSMGGAFARLDFVDSKLVGIDGPEEVRPKMNQNEMVYPEGFITVDSTWRNLLVKNPSLNFGFRGATEGDDIVSYAAMIANSKGFSRCMVKRVYRSVCGENPTDVSMVERLTESFETEGRNLKALFGQVAVEHECIPHMGQLRSDKL